MHFEIYHKEASKMRFQLKDCLSGVELNKKSDMFNRKQYLNNEFKKGQMKSITYAFDVQGIVYVYIYK